MWATHKLKKKKKDIISKDRDLVMLLVNASKHLSCEKATIFLLKNYIFSFLSFILLIFTAFPIPIKSIILCQTSSRDWYKICRCIKITLYRKINCIFLLNLGKVLAFIFERTVHGSKKIYILPTVYKHSPRFP